MGAGAEVTDDRDRRPAHQTEHLRRPNCQLLSVFRVFLTLKLITQSTYPKPGLEKEFAKSHGDRLVADLQREHVKAAHGEEGRPHLTAPTAYLKRCAF